MLWRVSRPIRTRSKPLGFIVPCQPALADLDLIAPDQDPLNVIRDQALV
jgi:hypothetical protein